ncbi:Thyroxine 5-deiodinase [Platysternon megacephalum]|uniref:Iodothyronine deiodinase n=1 Tax=Platysternon megacephalum TaxID=55544 RepID=A0A4D9EXC2_9SAUR|nr:Thyroxine 5-deiodinase [Platysternon megacephalum]
MLHSLGVHTLQLLTQVAACILLFPRFLLTALMLWLLDFLCIRKKVLLMGSRAEEEASPGQEPPPDDPPVCVSDSNRMFTLESLKAVWHGQKLDFFKSAHVGSSAPNLEVIQLDGQKRLRILDYARGKRPLILNFGSCT